MKRKQLTASICFYNFIGLAVAIGGWLWEVLLFLVKEHHFVNRGFLYGPYLPVYGIGAVLLSVLFYYQKPECIRSFFLSMCGGCLTELAAGWLLWHIFHRKYWDYSGYPLNLGGYICLFSALGFGIFGVLWLKWIGPFLFHTWNRLQCSVQVLTIGLFDLALLTDFIFSLMQPNDGTDITFSFLCRLCNPPSK
ncbi:MAG: putative ABC transporter permease [Eubacterium sp.]|nr:putative ABC transporter permease [Eubacterium sp.]